MIRIILGKVGSGKTAKIVKELVLNKTHRHYFSNIKTKGISYNHLINSKMIIKKVWEDEEGNILKKPKLKLNTKFWKDTKKKYGAISVIIDEAHMVLNARKSMSSINHVLTDFLALVRRVVGEDSAGYGELVLISQNERQLDVLAKEGATSVHYHVCHFQKECSKCGYTWNENNETFEPLWECPKCNGYKIQKFNHIIEVWHFKNIEAYNGWKVWGERSYHRHYYIKDIEKYFKNYSTLQWDNLISDY